MHDPDTATIEDRVAAYLILLYAQPLSKMVTLNTSRDDKTYLTLGPKPLLLVPLLDALVAHYHSPSPSAPRAP